MGIVGALGGPTTAPFWELGIVSNVLKVFTPVAQATMDLHGDVQRRRKS
jgi:hypothetical protein